MAIAELLERGTPQYPVCFSDALVALRHQTIAQAQQQEDMHNKP